MALLGVNQLNKILNEFLEEFELIADISSDFSYWYNHSLIEYSLVVSDFAGALYMDYVHSLAPDIKCDLFLISFLHELGHHETFTDLDDAENNYCQDVKTDIYLTLASGVSLEKRIELNKIYFSLPDENAATMWAINYIRNNKEKISQLWEKVQPAITLIYELNDVKLLEGER